MTKKKSLTIISVILLLLTCGMCFLVAGCSSDNIDGGSFTCKTTSLSLKKDDTLETALTGVEVTFKFGYDVTIDGKEHKKGSEIKATGYSEMIENGFVISGFKTSSETGTDSKGNAITRTLTISYLNKSVNIKYTVS